MDFSQNPQSNTMENKNILLVDSEKNVLLSYQTVLKEEGYNVEIATIEKVALEKILSQKFAVLITEFYLKGKNTTDLIKQTRQNYPEIYIIMITAASLNQNMYEAVINAGVDDFFTKPFSIKSLILNMKKGIKKRGLILNNVQLEEKLIKMNNLFSSDPFYNDKYKIICNSLCFRKRLQYEMARAKRYNHQLSLVLLDINYEINSFADENKQNISNEVSQILLKNTRQTDIITRYNGSFALILLETSTDGTKILTGRLKDRISNIPVIEDKLPHQQIMKNLKIDYILYPEQSESIHKWVNETEKNWQNELSELDSNPITTGHNK